MSFPGVEDNPAAHIEQGFLTMTSEAVGSLFRPIVAEIIGLIEEQIHSLQAQGKTAAGLVLVGGFGQSNCLYKCLQARFADIVPPPAYSESFVDQQAGRRFEVMQPRNVWTSVVRGAVLRGLEGQELVLSRKARRHYGVVHIAQYRPNYHNLGERFWDDLEKKWKVDNRLTWYVRKGDTLKSDDPVLFPFHNNYRKGASRRNNNYMVFCDEDEPPEVYDPTDKGSVRKLCSLSVDLGTVPAEHWVDKTNSDDEPYQKLTYLLGMQIGSGGLSFDLRVNDIIYGDVLAEFK
jgi:cell division ATPase FtsA